MVLLLSAHVRRNRFSFDESRAGRFVEPSSELAVSRTRATRGRCSGSLGCSVCWRVAVSQLPPNLSLDRTNFLFIAVFVIVLVVPMTFILP